MSNLRAVFEKNIGKYSIYVPPSNFDYSVNISLKYNYLYTETPKVGCSTIKTTLQKMELNDPDFYREDFEDIHNRNFSPLLKPSQIGSFEKFITGSVFKFCFSRNPYSRLLSAYLEKIKSNKPQKRQILLHLGKNYSDIDQEVSFDEFVNVVCEQPIINMNHHWRVQYYQTFQEFIEYDFVGKLENFSDDFKIVLAKLNKNYAHFLKDERRHSTRASDHLSKFYTPSLIKIVQDKYAKDFEYFGYERELRAANIATI